MTAAAALLASNPFPIGGGELLWTVVFGLFVCVLIVGWWRADRIDGAAQRRQVRGPAPQAAPDRTTNAPVPPNHLLVGPPMVEGQTAVNADTVVPLRDWLVHFHATAGNIWSEVATEFYTAVMEDPQIADFFRYSDQAALQKHFLAALITITDGGITADMVERLRLQHAALRNGNGEPITPAVFDRAADALIEVLRSKSVPEPTLDQVQRVLACLRGAIASHPNPVAGG
jgi:hypothetical protein